LIDSVDVGAVDEWKWTCPRPEFETLVKQWGASSTGQRATRCSRDTTVKL
jgi:hypothetical protein